MDIRTITTNKINFCSHFIEFSFSCQVKIFFFYKKKNSFFFCKKKKIFFFKKKKEKKENRFLFYTLTIFFSNSLSIEKLKITKFKSGWDTVLF